MERAGQCVVESFFEEWPELAEGGVAPRPADSPQSISAKEKGTLASKKRAVVLCGPGNNGGDGFVVARLLHERGWVVEVFLYGDAEKLPPDARVNYERWCGLEEIHRLTIEAINTLKQRPTLLIDAMFGIGLTRAIPLGLAKAYHAIGNLDVGDNHRWLVPFHKISIDCVSGFDCDSGQVLLPEGPKKTGEDDVDFKAHWNWWKNDASHRLLHSDLTVCFHRKKIGHGLSESIGKVVVVDIGLGAEDRHPAHLVRPRLTNEVVQLDFERPKGRSRAIWPGQELKKNSFRLAHKFESGHAFVLSGETTKTGAARLAARGALRIGAGVVSLGVPASARQEAASQLTAIMLMQVGDAEALKEALQDKRINALCLGPALGLDRAKPLVAAALDAGLDARPTVLDADALSAFADEPDALFAMLHEKCVLTPHGGEFARLFPDISEKLNAVPTKGPAYSKVDATREAAKRAGCVVLFKGADTVIADSDGRCSINSAHYERAAPWLATAGSGDVLAGFITGLLARGFAPMAAAETAAWLHVECALKFGPGLIAEDIPEQLPAVFRDLGL
jgi:hydroxyethylthiazole kinase-like uncharacterized protein yjeF